VRRKRLLLHLPIALLHVEHLNAAARVQLVNSIVHSATGLAVQVIALDENALVAKAPTEHVAVRHVLHLNTLANVETCAFAALGPLDVRYGAQAEAVFACRVEVAVDCDQRLAGANFKRIAYLKIELEVVDCTPECGRWRVLLKCE